MVISGDRWGRARIWKIVGSSVKPAPTGCSSVLFFPTRRDRMDDINLHVALGYTLFVEVFRRDIIDFVCVATRRYGLSDRTDPVPIFVPSEHPRIPTVG